jgi:hypothetical protein
MFKQKKGKLHMYNVIKFQAPFERIKKYNASSEVSLYKAIITQAIIDASNSSDECSAAKTIELEAKDWLFNNSDDFNEICCRAEIEPSFVVKIAKDVIKLNRQKKDNFEYIKQQKILYDELKMRCAMVM